MVDDDAKKLRKAAFDEFDQMITNTSYTAYDAVVNGGIEVIQNKVFSYLSGLFEQATFIVDGKPIEGILAKDIIDAKLSYVSTFTAYFIDIIGINFDITKYRTYVENSLRNLYITPEENKILQRESSFIIFIQNKAFERNDYIIGLFNRGKEAIGSAYESGAWFKVGGINITLKDERDVYEKITKAEDSWWFIIELSVAIVLFIAVFIYMYVSGGVGILALPKIILFLKPILETISMLPKIAMVAVALMMLITLPNITPMVTSQHNATLNLVEAFLTHEAASTANVLSIATAPQASLGKETKLMINVDKDTFRNAEPIISIVVSPDGRVIDMSLSQTFPSNSNYETLSSSVRFPSQPGIYRILAMTIKDIKESSVKQVETTQISPNVSVSISTDKQFYNHTEPVTINTVFANAASERVDNLTFSIDVLNTTYNKTGFLSLEPASSKIETLNIVPEMNRTYKVRATILAGLYEIDTRETGFTVEHGSGVSVNIESKEVYEPTNNVTANLTIKNIGTASYQGNINITTVDTLNSYMEVYDAGSFLSIDTSETKNLGYIILPKENATPGIYRSYLKIDNSKYVIPFTVSANGTIFITLQTDKMIYSASEGAIVNISVKDVAFNAENATLNLTLIDPYKNITYSYLKNIIGNNGNYSSMVSPLNKSLNGTYILSVKGTKDGYRVYSDQAFFIVNERTKLTSNIPRTIKINPTDKINFYVKTEAGIPVEDAFVTIGSYWFNITRLTNGNGLAEFNAQSINKTGRIEVHIEKGGYSSFIGKIEIILGDLNSISNPVASAGPTWINWTWTNPTDLNFSHVMVYIDSNFTANVSAPLNYYNATGFAPNTEHTISTRTVDMNGNINPAWVNHTARTASQPTTTPPTYVNGSLFSNTTWYASKSPYIVTGSVTLFPGFMLTIEPGVTVKFYNNTGLVIRGTLNSSGTETQRIVFTSANASTKGVWSGINVATSLGGKATIKFVNFSYAGTAINVECCWSGGPVEIVEIYDSVFIDNVIALGGYAGWDTKVERSIFENNTYAVTQADKIISYSTFKNNSYGLYATERIDVYYSTFVDNQVGLYGGRGEVKFSNISNNGIGVQGFFEGFTLSNNTISNNNVGVILTEYDTSSPPVNYNNIYGNHEYNMKNSGTSNKDARYNWWGTIDTTEIDLKIYDGYDDPSVGIINYQPILTAPTPTPTATPISSCTTITSPGKYVLTQSIINSPASTCISITSSNVTLDGAGYTIDGVDAANSYGVYVYSSSNITVKNLIVTDWSDGILIYSSNNNTLINNTANSNDVGIYLFSFSNNNMLITNNASNNYEGIYIVSSSYNTLSSNIVSNNYYGINPSSSSSNMISNNYVLNYNVGIFLYASNSNTFYNNFFNNTNNFGFSGMNSNKWNTTKTQGTNIISGPYLGGNFWANPSGTGFSQTCADADSDGICDSSYVLASQNIDYLPLAYTSLPPPLASITLEAVPTTVQADGVSYSTIIATLRDSSGQPYPGANVYFTTNFGSLSTNYGLYPQGWLNISDSQGKAYAIIKSISTGTATVTGVSGSLTKTVSVAFTTQDVTPPVISNIAASGITQNSATITWNTNEPASSLVKYGTSPGTYTNTQADSALIMAHSIGLTGLTPGTTYYYVVNSTDASGNSAQSSEGSFTTQSPPVGTSGVSISDITLKVNKTGVVPIMIKNVTNAGAATVDLSYNPSVVHVINVANSSFDTTMSNINNATGITTIGAFQITSAGLNGDIKLADVTLKAVGSSGQISPLNLSITTLKTTDNVQIKATTLNGTFMIAVNDTTSPSVTSASANPYEILLEEPDNLDYKHMTTRLNATVTDESAIANVAINLSSIGGSQAQPMTNIGGNVYSITTNATLGYVTSYQKNQSLRVNATDNYGNSNTSVSIKLKVKRNGDVNEDGAVDIADAMWLAKNRIGFSSYPINELAADVNGDGVIDIADAMYIAKHVIQKPGYEKLY